MGRPAELDRARLGDELARGMQALGLEAPAGAEGRLLDYLELLHRWNRTYNLTAVRDPAAMVVRHLLDSLVVVPHVHGRRVIDVGAGAGLPGIPLAILRPDISVTLLDSNGKKTRFMAHAARTLGLEGVEVVRTRLEDYHPEDCFDSVLSRAFATVRQMLDWGGHLACGSGKILAMKGKYPGDELGDIPDDYSLEAVHPLSVPGLDSERHLVVIRPLRTPGEH